MGKAVSIERLNGQELYVEKMTLKCINNQMMLSLVVQSKGEILCAEFDRVSEFCVEKLSSPIIIQGLEIVDNTTRGWESVHQYTVRDFEDDTISFFCQKVKVSVLKTSLLVDQP